LMLRSKKGAKSSCNSLDIIAEGVSVDTFGFVVECTV